MRTLSLALVLFVSLGAEGSSAQDKPPVEGVGQRNAVPCNLTTVTFDWDFALGDQGFSPDDCDQGGSPVWEWGPTSHVPGAPANTWGTILEADYRNDSGHGLISPTWIVDDQSYLVEVYHYYDIEAVFDGCNVSIGTWPDEQVIEPMGGYTVSEISPSADFYAWCVDMEPGWTGFSQGWIVDCFDLSAFMNQQVNLEFAFGSDVTVVAPGWYLARVRVGGANQLGPCLSCGPGEHWIDECFEGMDEVADHQTPVWLDLDLDPNCQVDMNLLMEPCPAPDNLVVIKRSEPLDDSVQFPGTRPVDGHLDVIDTELISMCLSAGGVILRAGSGQGQGAELQPSFGVIAERPEDAGLADSFFEVYFEMDLGGGMFVYNHEPVRIEGVINCVAPMSGYEHLGDCLPLYTDPVGGEHVANLGAAAHTVNPGDDPAVCCLAGDCQITTLQQCFELDGIFHPESRQCQPDPCPGASAVEDPGGPAGVTAFLSAAPNPSTGKTVLKYRLAEPGDLDIGIYDLSGHLVRRLLSRTGGTGVASIEWDGLDDAGRPVGSGVYFARLSAGGVVKSRRMIVLN